MTLAIAAAVMLLPVAHAQKRGTAAAMNFASDDDVFLALRDASRAGDMTRVEELAARIPNYVIPSYVDYYRLKPRIAMAPEQEIRNYLERYKGSAIADRLRNDWLLELGRTRNWALFDEQYPLFELDDDTQLKCYALMSKATKGQPVADAARALLTAPQNYGEGCTALITQLAESGQFSLDDVWAQIRLIAESGGNTWALRRIVGASGASETAILQAIDKPESVLTRLPANERAAKEVFIVALGRAARNSPAAAVKALTIANDRLNERETATAWAQIALQASYKLAPEALLYWDRTAGAPLSLDAHQWKVRTALRAGDWKKVKSAIAAMPASLRDDPAWVYWLGRALLEEGRYDEAQAKFRSLAGMTNFYGQLALEELDQKITIPPRAQPVSAEELAPMAQNAGFRRAFKFFDLNMRFEGYREWNWELRKMNEREHLAAAEFARQNNVLDRMVNTSDRTRTELDFTQRFPSPFRDVMRVTTQPLGLDMAWVYGLIRQESRFIQSARSHVGASGLMQLMPATAQWVARKIGLANFSPSQVNDINTNILLGANYLNLVLADLDGSQALATAAYNAGPGRPRNWRSTLTRPVEGAIFAESIPFSETRGYVKNVLSNATYYAALFESKPQSLKARLGIVTPQSFAPTALP